MDANAGVFGVESAEETAIDVIEIGIGRQWTTKDGGTVLAHGVTAGKPDVRPARRAHEAGLLASRLEPEGAQSVQDGLVCLHGERRYARLQRVCEVALHVALDQLHHLGSTKPESL